jgi:murein DD-endopeptidase MepM/ murein hydrolase activator NlpD
MSMLQRYRRGERRLFERAAAAAIRLARGARGAWSAFLYTGKQGISVLVVPASEAQPRGFRITFFGAAVLVLGAAAIVASIFLFAGNSSSARASLADSAGRYSDAQRELDQFREQTSRLMGVYGEFNKALSTIAGALPQSTAGQATRESIDRLNRAFGPARSGDEVAQIAAVKSSLLEAVPLITEYGATLGKMGAVQRGIPSIWPIKGGIGHISTIFGYTTNDFTGQRYFHQGIDCSTYRSGDPIVATADGKVVLAAMDNSYGLTVVIAHAQGFSTRYGHMDRILVRIGQTVKQGQTIGILGNTGVSTGPHVHYEVMIGDKRMNPFDFLWSRQETAGGD